jgi:hypothetical protein
MMDRHIPGGLMSILGMKRRTFGAALAAVRWPLAARADDVGLVNN